jgi:hypothetical protein
MPQVHPGKYSSEPVSSRYDDRIGLGYGILKNKFHKPRQANSTYPYLTDEKSEELQELPEDEESVSAVAKKVIRPVVNDPMAHKSVNPFYFAAGNTKLADCFFNVNAVLQEVESLGDSMSPISIKKSRRSVSPSGGAAFPFGIKIRRLSGDERGFASSPPISKVEAELDYEEEPELEFYTLKDLADAEDRVSGEFAF